MKTDLQEAVSRALALANAQADLALWRQGRRQECSTSTPYSIRTAGRTLLPTPFVRAYLANNKVRSDKLNEEVATALNVLKITRVRPVVDADASGHAFIKLVAA